MTTYLARRLIQGVIVLLAVSMVCFFLFRYTGDPVLMLAGKYATQEEREQVRKAYGLDRPAHEQYVNFLAGAVKGDFGRSYVSQIDALDMILERFPATFELALTAMSISFIFGVGLGVMVSINPNGWAQPDHHGRIPLRHLHPHLSDRYSAGDALPSIWASCPPSAGGTRSRSGSGGPAC
jgi:ABC-type dipeptide/oligopeptide/nickel transport system permease component